MKTINTLLAFALPARCIALQNHAPEGNYHIWTITPHGRDATE